MPTDFSFILEDQVALAPAALGAGANLSAYVPVHNITRPATAMIQVGALGGATVTVTSVKCADDAAGTNSIDLDMALSVRTTIGIDRDSPAKPIDMILDVDNDLLRIEFTAAKPFVAVEITTAGGTPIGLINVQGQHERTRLS